MRNPVERVVSQYFSLCHYGSRADDIGATDSEGFLMSDAAHNPDRYKGQASS